MSLAPIALFVYNRADHARRTIEALLKNELALKSDLIIFSDGAKDIKQEDGVSQVRDYIHTVNGFKSVAIIERPNNMGLANSIIDGVTSIVNSYGSVIVLEDDIVTSPYFLEFMNNALTHYENEKNIWHISGWNYPIDGSSLDDVFFWQMMNCWGWATWSDRWEFFEKNPEKILKHWDAEKIKRFNLDGVYNAWSQVEENYRGKMNTWAIFWYASIFDNQGLCMNPTHSLVENIGHDGSGENCSIDSQYLQKKLNSRVVVFPKGIAPSSTAVNRIKKFYKSMQVPFYKKIIRLLKKAFI